MVETIYFRDILDNYKEPEDYRTVIFTKSLNLTNIFNLSYFSKVSLILISNNNGEISYSKLKSGTTISFILDNDVAYQVTIDENSHFEPDDTFIFNIDFPNNAFYKNSTNGLNIKYLNEDVNCLSRVYGCNFSSSMPDSVYSSFIIMNQDPKYYQPKQYQYVSSNRRIFKQIIVSNEPDYSTNIYATTLKRLNEAGQVYTEVYTIKNEYINESYNLVNISNNETDFDGTGIVVNNDYIYILSYLFNESFRKYCGIVLEPGLSNIQLLMSLNNYQTFKFEYMTFTETNNIVQGIINFNIRNSYQLIKAITILNTFSKNITYQARIKLNDDKIIDLGTYETQNSNVINIDPYVKVFNSSSWYFQIIANQDDLPNFVNLNLKVTEIFTTPYIIQQLF